MDDLEVPLWDDEEEGTLEVFLLDDRPDPEQELGLSAFNQYPAPPVINLAAFRHCVRASIAETVQAMIEAGHPYHITVYGNAGQLMDTHIETVRRFR